MNQVLILETGNERIGVIRNPYERAVFHYMHGLDWIGFDKWIQENNLISQVKAYKKCTQLIAFDDWQNELKNLNLDVKDISVMQGQKTITDWKSWYTLKSKQVITEVFKDDILTYGFSY